MSHHADGTFNEYSQAFSYLTYFFSPVTTNLPQRGDQQQKGICLKRKELLKLKCNQHIGQQNTSSKNSITKSF